MAESHFVNNNLRNSAINYNDLYFLTSSDNPRKQLGNVLFNGDNFINWSRGVKMALGVKNKLGFINRYLPIPTSDYLDFNKWTRNDYIVLSWLTFSMEPIIADSFMFASSARELWSDLSDRFDKSNAPLLYELHISLSRIEQQNLSIAEYYGKFKFVWDKLQVLEDHLYCSCGALAHCTCNLLKKAWDAVETKKLNQFICGLNKGYDNMKTNILSMDLLPTVLKAYHMLQQIEEHHNLDTPVNKISDVSALYSAKQTPYNLKFQQQKKDFKKSKLDLICDHCKKKGHTVEQCFKLVGTPDWYVNLKGKQQPSTLGKGFAAQVTENSGLLGSYPLDMPTSSTTVQSENLDTQMVSAFYKEVLKMMQQNAGLTEHDPASCNFASTVSAFLSHSTVASPSWIIDT